MQRILSSIYHKSLLLLVLAPLFLFLACNGGQMPERNVFSPSIKDVPESAWKKVSAKKIYFGHQSVGFNIIDGIKDLMKENSQIRINIVETNNPSDLNVPLFAHSRVGKNTDPGSKIKTFAKSMKKGIGRKADIAFFKFCYVDITAGTDIAGVFRDYKIGMSRLKAENPRTTFIHVTVPLTLTKTSFKTWIKKLIGKEDIWEYDDNIMRNEFNELLRNEYDGKESIFDLATIESTFSNGTRSSFTKTGKIYYTMVPDYTDDGGHLNEVGRKIVAEQLLIFLANLSK